MNDANISEIDHLSRVKGVLERVFRRNGYEAVEFNTPLSDLLTSEIEAQTDAEEEAQKKEEATRLKTFSLMLDYIFADGPHPGASMRRLYALARAFRPEHIANMNGTDLAQMFNESRAAQSWRTLKIFDGYLKERGAKSGKLPFQKSEEARAVYSEIQKGNTNRRGKTGRRAKWG